MLSIGKNKYKAFWAGEPLVIQRSSLKFSGFREGGPYVTAPDKRDFRRDLSAKGCNFGKTCYNSG